MSNYQKTIGLEIHLKLKTKTKIFCQCKNEQNFDSLLPNTNICPICTGQPGALPLLTQDVRHKALLIGKALNCKINKISQFDRKNYFYPDLPMGYQITQFYKPTNVDGEMQFFSADYKQTNQVKVLDAHMECDTAKSIHSNKDALLDFNRAGTPLIEIVTGPDFHKETEVICFLKELQRIATYNNISDAEMDKGQMRIDVNISVSKDEILGTRVELKNINSFGMIKRAIIHESQRQIDLLDTGKQISHETRKWNDLKGESTSMRSKETDLDYRYFPDPDMPKLKIKDKTMERLYKQELIIPYDIIKKFIEKYGFHKEYINALIGDKEVLEYFFECMDFLSNKSRLSTKSSGDVNGKKESNKKVQTGNNVLSLDLAPRLIAKRIAGPISAYMKENFVGINELKFNKEGFVEFLKITREGRVMDNQMKIVMEEMLDTGKKVREIIREKGFNSPAVGSGELENIVKKVLDENLGIVEQYKGGKESVIGFFVGQIMKKTEGKADPNKIKEIITKLLN